MSYERLTTSSLCQATEHGATRSVCLRRLLSFSRNTSATCNERDASTKGASVAAEVHGPTTAGTEATVEVVCDGIKKRPPERSVPSREKKADDADATWPDSSARYLLIYSARTRGVARPTPSMIWLSLLLTLGTRATSSATNVTNVSPLASTAKPITTTKVVYQQFAMEPVDQTAVIGSQVTFPCRVLNQKGPIQWTKDDFGLGTVRNLTGYERYAMIGSDEEVHELLRAPFALLQARCCKRGRGAAGAAKIAAKSRQREIAFAEEAMAIEL
ncbi:Irregular chiasm C-roughest protein [Eufriesea mexicana]|nr:Irregular chiasm C-roughest protein [Eufriesea mexicana]